MIVNRTFTIQGSSNHEQEPSQPLPSFFDRSAIVMLGDPGAGKSTSFKQAADQEPDSIYTTVRSFVELNLERYRGKTLYLDALDEMRGRTEDGKSVLGKLRGRLDELGCPRFRLSCRAADWYGSSDKADLSEVSSDGSLTILEIDPLGDTEVTEIVRFKGIDPVGFLAEARAKGVAELLKNPQTLTMLLDVVEQGDWPETRVELYQKTTEILVREHNEVHRKGLPHIVDNESLLQAAGYLSAIILCGGAVGLALDEDAADNSFLTVCGFGGTTDTNIEVVHRRLFHSQGAERVSPVHRTIAEYLAAKHFCKLVAFDKLPLNRVLALITGHDGGTLSDLRGIYAWLSCLCLEHAESLIAVDPLGVVLYGDVSLFSPTLKRFTIKCLISSASKNPWLRADNWSPKPFGALSSPEMEPYFREVLSDTDQHPVAVSFVVDAIRYGYPLPVLGDLLLDIARDNTRMDFLRKDALKAFIRICGDRVDALQNLLDEIHDGQVDDLHCELRAYLLSFMYPHVLGPVETLKYIIEEPKSFIGKYWKFIRYELISVMKLEDIPAFLDAIANKEPIKGRLSSYSWCGFLGKLLQTGLSHYGEVISSDQLYRWLGVAFDRHRQSILDEEDSKAVRDWLAAHSACIRTLFEFWLSITPVEKLSTSNYRLGERLFHIDWPEGFDQWLFEQAVAAEDDQKALFLYRQGVQIIFNRRDFDPDLLEDMYLFVAENPRFEETLKREMYCEIPDWRLESAQHAIERQQQKESTRIEHIRWVLEHKEQVRSGRHYDALRFLAQIYFGMFSDVDRELTPFARIESITDAECAEAGIEGFIAALQHQDDTPTVAMISESSAQNSYFPYGFVVLAGIELVFERSNVEILTLPDSVLGSALAYHYASGEGKDREWVKYLLSERPALSADVLEIFWRTALASKREHVSGLYACARDEAMGPVVKRIILPLLKDFANCRMNDLENLLYAAITYLEHGSLLALAKEILNRKNSVKGKQRLLWYGVAYMLNSIEFEQKLKDYCGGDQSKIASLYSFLFPSVSEGQGPKMPELSISSIKVLVSLGGKVFNPERLSDLGGYDSQSSTVRALIDRLSSKDTGEATQAIRSLMTQRSLLKWHESLAHSLDVQIRKRREVLFQFPTMSQVVGTLAGGSPANSADLQALVVDHLILLGDDISNGSTDGYKAFWNVDSYGRATSPRPEETCRDYLLDRLRERLRPFGIDSEPEGHYARDKRADIKVLFRNSLNLPVEIKRHYHSELWTAPIDQLQRQYMRDPSTGNRGVYLVFWFGINKSRKLPKPPAGIAQPATSEQLVKALRQVIPDTDRALIEVVVIDCSGK